MRRSLLVLVFGGSALALRAATVSIAPDADSFVRSFAPASNYGAGGALSVSGSAAVNGSGDQNGSFDTLMRFPTAGLASSLDAMVGSDDWIVTGARLVTTEMAVPDNDIFNRGVGAFEIRWIASDSWLEGTGKPMTPTTDGATWADLPLILNSNLDISLGVFTNGGGNAQVAFRLQIPDTFLADLRSGGELSLYLTASSPEVGFTLNSRNFGNTNAQPKLEVTAAANPRPRIENIALSGADVLVSFAATTNWTYRLQRANALPAPSPAAWSDVLTIRSQAFPTNVVYSDGATNPAVFYRLAVSP